MSAVQLSAAQADVLCYLATNRNKEMNESDTHFNARAMSALVKKGMAMVVSKGVWRITDAGLERTKSIY